MGWGMWDGGRGKIGDGDGVGLGEESRGGGN